MTSLQVAESFEKEHKNMLRDIEAILPQVPEKFVKLNFELYEYPIETGIGTRMAKSYLLSKDAFTLLTMGYTGEKAMAFKVAYIARFNEMEKALQANAPTSDGFTLLPWRGAAATLPERRASHDEVHTNGGGLCRRHLFGYGLAERLEPR